MGLWIVGSVAALALQCLPRAQVQPGTMAAEHGLAVCIYQLQAQRRICRHPRPHGTVRLHRHITDNLTHAEVGCPTKLGAADIAHVFVGDQHAFGDTQEAHPPLVRRDLGRVTEIRDRVDARQPRVHEIGKPAIQIVHTADIDARHIGVGQRLIPIRLRHHGGHTTGRGHGQFGYP